VLRHYTAILQRAKIHRDRTKIEVPIDKSLQKKFTTKQYLFYMFPWATSQEVNNAVRTDSTTVDDAQQTLCDTYFKHNQPPLLPNSMDLILKTLVKFSDDEIKLMRHAFPEEPDEQAAWFARMARESEDEFTAKLGLASSEKTRALYALLTKSGWVDVSKVLPLS
jgi:hypothetical protein